MKVKNVKIWQYIKEIRKLLPYINGNKKIIKRYKGTQVVYNYIPEDTGTTTYADDALVFEFTGDTLTYKLKNTTYTATTSPTIVNLSDLGYDANTYFMFDALFYNQKNLTKVLHFPKITGTNYLGYSLFRSCNNVEYIDLSNIGNLNTLHLLFNGCTSLKNLNLDNVDLSNYTYSNNNSAFYNVPNDIQISMNGCNCESIVTIKQALNDSGIVTYNNNVVTNNNNCTFEPSETIEYNVDFNIDESETYNEELKADYIYMIVTNRNVDGVSSSTESDITEEVSYEYEQFEEYGEDKIRCTIYYNGNNIYEITYKGKLSNTDTNIVNVSDCDIPIYKKLYIDGAGLYYLDTKLYFSTMPCASGQDIVLDPNRGYIDLYNGTFTVYSESEKVEIDGIEYIVFDISTVIGYPLYLASNTYSEIQNTVDMTSFMFTIPQ